MILIFFQNLVLDVNPLVPEVFPYKVCIGMKTFLFIITTKTAF